MKLIFPLELFTGWGSWHLGVSRGLNIYLWAVYILLCYINKYFSMMRGTGANAHKGDTGLTFEGDMEPDQAPTVILATSGRPRPTYIFRAPCVVRLTGRGGAAGWVPNQPPPPIFCFPADGVPTPTKLALNEFGQLTSFIRAESVLLEPDDEAHHGSVPAPPSPQQWYSSISLRSLPRFNFEGNRLCNTS